MYEWVHGAMNFQPGPAEERPDDREDHRDREQDAEQQDRDLAMTRSRVGVAIDVRQQHEDQHRAGGYEDPGDERIEAREQLLEPGEVPRRLRRLGRDVRVREPAERRAERDREAEHDRRGAERDHDVAHQQMRPREHGVVDRSRRFGDRLAVDDAEQAHAPAVELGRGLRHGAAAGAAPRPGARSPPRRTRRRSSRCTAKPSLRTRQMCTASISTRSIGSTATCSA